MQLYELRKDFNRLKVAEEKSRNKVEVIKQKSMEVIQVGFNKAIKSFKVKAIIKGRVNNYYQILDLCPSHTLLEGK